MKVLLSIAVFGIVSCFAQASQEESPWQLKWRLDGYYGFSTPSSGSGLTRVGRQFDLRNNELRLATGEVQVAYRPTGSPWSVLVTPFYGDNADILYGLESGESKFAKHLAQAYVSYSFDGHTVDFGKYYSWIGGESAESSSSDLYSRGLLFANGQPTNHYGLRVSGQLSGEIRYGFFVTNGWNQYVREAPGVSIGVQVSAPFSENLSLTVGGLFGSEGSGTPNNAGSYGGAFFASPGMRDTQLYDAVLVWQAAPNLKATVNGTFGSADGAEWYGLSGVVRQELGAGWAIALRAESYRDADGLRFGQPVGISSFAIGTDYATSANSMIRLEFRSDWASRDIFVRPGGSTAEGQNTINLAYSIKF